MSKEMQDKIKETLGIDKVDGAFDLAGLDSLARAEVIGIAEEVHKVELTNKDILGLSTLAQLEKLIKERGK